MSSIRIAFFDAHHFDQAAFNAQNQSGFFDIGFYDVRLSINTVSLASGYDVVCCFVNDRVDEPTLNQLSQYGIKLVALRCAGFNNVDLEAAKKLGIGVVRVPAYSPYAVAEHAMALILSLNRKTHRSYLRIKEQNFSLDGLVGFDLYNKTVGVVGTGKIGAVFAHIAKGFGCKLLAYDKYPDSELADNLGIRYVSVEELIQQSDIISLHLPLMPETHHMIDANAFSMMKKGVTLINTSRGALIDASALIDALKSGIIDAAGLDVYEEEEGIFFEDLSGQVLQDDTLARLTTFPNVMITSHQGFLTREALQNIAETTFDNIRSYLDTGTCRNQVA